jgi:hypothetical protein
MPVLISPEKRNLKGLKQFIRCPRLLRAEVSGPEGSRGMRDLVGGYPATARLVGFWRVISA